MRIKIKKTDPEGTIRFESSGDVKEVLLNEDFLHPGEEGVSICYRGKNSSGIIDFTPEEIEKIYETIKTRIHLIKGFKMFTSKDGARML